MKNVLVISTDGEELLANIEASGNSLVINGTDIPSSQWIGTGTYTTTVNGHQISITKASDNTDNLMLEKTADYTYAFTVLDTETEFNVSDQEKLDGIGTKFPDTTTYGSFSDKSVASSTTMQYWNSFTLPSTGTWIINMYCDFAANSNGYRHLAVLSSGQNGASLREVYMANSTRGFASERAKLGLTLLSQISTDANLTFYIGVAQNSGSALTARFRYRAVKIA